MRRAALTMARLLSPMLASACLLLVTMTVQAGSPVWQLDGSERSAPFYLAGSIHLLREADYPLPAALEQAFADSRVLVLEMDLSADNQADFQQRLLEQGFYHDGSRLSDHVSAASLARLQAFGDARHLPLDNLLGLKPWLLGLSLMQIEFSQVGLSPDHGVDAHFYQRAIASERTVLALENSEQQLQALQAMESVGADVLLNRLLDDMDQLATSFQNLLDDWKQGRFDAIDAQLSAEMRNQQPALYAALLPQRNHNWLPQLENLLQGDQAVLVLVGSAHLAGPDSLIQLLAERGYHFRSLVEAQP